MKKILERDVQKAILDWLQLKNIFAIRLNNIGVPLKDGGFRPSPVKGLSDILCVIKGKAVFIEVKRPGGHTTDTQEAFLQQADDAGAVCIIADDLDFVIEILTPLIKSSQLP